MRGKHSASAGSGGEPPLAPPPEAFLNALSDEGSGWEKYRPCHEIAIALHESPTVRAESHHEPWR